MIVNELAILRYQQLVENIDRSLVPGKIITPALHHMVTTLGDGEYPVNNFIAVVKNQIVVNVKLQAG
ncbi:hypothetical protein HGH93_21345 [Chitinophaga polysaccharea]|uniref:hypothetical protein n=1 Tax=Chitinophaga polysaccharea TaxID=1293035 RepID=UPI001455AC56|nr:hypothetical protein [Chitinophaga polysaccharea]NLR60669.1 hypothetical protein [Chitinophaga polysaccharea]